MDNTVNYADILTQVIRKESAMQPWDSPRRYYYWTFPRVRQALPTLAISQ